MVAPERTTVDQSSAASVPIEISVSIVAAKWRAFSAAARWNGHPAHSTTGADSANASHSQPVTRPGGTTTKTTGAIDSSVATTSRSRSIRASRSPARSASRAARGGAAL